MTRDELGELIDKSNAYYSTCSLIDNNRGRKVIIRPSSLKTFMVNRFAWAAAQVLNVSFEGNSNTHIGTAVHTAADYFYQEVLKGNKAPTVRECLLSAVKTVRFLTADKAERIEIYQEAKRLFEIYYPHAITQSPVYSELPVGIDLNDWLTVKGTLDRIEDKDGNHIVVDIKTSGSDVYGTKVESSELTDLKNEFKSLSKEYSTQIRALEKELSLKKTTDERKVQIEPELSKLTISRDTDLEALEEQISSIESVVNAEQHINDTVAAKEKYGLQLAVYALLYEIETGIPVNTARIELLVKTKEPRFRVFEFDLSDMKIDADKSINYLQMVLEHWRNGVPASVLFGFNPESFRGAELSELGEL